ncbi:MAG: outer membrane protein assembly factor BamA [Bacteroidia bacterium]|nr:outer membrane protein assembly factor BamA [Bacteroidia bacterium]MCX7764223.1 outer membrane protein assembly factor BamA [Bacteroidia bacterium]MDW8056900.1 outer membrane protein assembly factor BamA [Bacteroidia bacterium]
MGISAARAALWTSLVIGGLWAQDLSTPRSVEIAGLRVEGTQYLDPQAVLIASGLYLSQKIRVPGDDLALAVQKLWRQGIFGDVQILADSLTESKVWLVIRVEERPRLSRYTFRGVSKTQSKELSEKVGLVRGTIFTETQRLNAQRIIRNYFQSKGYYEVQVSTQVEPDTGANSVKVLFLVKRGPRVKIDRIELIGLQANSPTWAKRKFKETKERRLYRFWKRSKFERNEFEKDQERLITALRNRGYRDAQVLKDSVWLVSPRRLRVQLQLYEGRRYYFREIHWEGNSIHDAATLTRILGIKRGDVYNPSLLERRLQMDPNGNDVASLYLDDGYLFFRAEPIERIVGEDSVDVTIRLFEGPQATNRRIIIEGNDRTRDRVILREIRTLPGDKFSRSALIRSQRELLALGYFDQEKTQIIPLPEPAEGVVDLKYAMEERPSDQVFLQGGWGGRIRDAYGNPIGGGLILTAGLRFNNFSFSRLTNKRAWRPLPTGDGQQLGLQIQLNGRGFQNYAINFLDPWFGGKKPNSFGVSAYYSVQRALFSDYYLSILGISVDLGRRLRFPDDFFRSYTTLSYRYYTAKNAFTLLGDRGSAFVNIFSLRQAIERTSIDAPIYPRSGSSVTLSVEVTPPWSYLLQQDYRVERDALRLLEFHKWRMDAQFYLRVVGNMVLAPRFRIGLLGRYNPAVPFSPFERFFLGGDGIQGFNIDGREIIALRGYASPFIGPANGSLAFSKFTIELRQAISLNPAATLWVHAFTEGGNAWGSLKAFNPLQLKRSFGVGVRIFLPMFGLLGVDYGYGIDDARDPNGLPLGGSRFHFMIGQQL